MESLNYKILCDNVLAISNEAGNAILKIYQDKINNFLMKFLSSKLV